MNSFDTPRNLSTRDEIMTRKIRNLAKGERKTLNKAIYEATYATHVHAIKETALMSRNLLWSRGDNLESNNFFFQHNCDFRAENCVIIKCDVYYFKYESLIYGYQYSMKITLSVRSVSNINQSNFNLLSSASTIMQ